MKNQIEIKKKIKSFNEIINVSGDKSISIRTVLLASQAIGKSKIYNLLESEDVINSLKSIKRLGIKYKKKKNYYEINAFGLNGYNSKKDLIIDAGNSGTLGRLLLGLLVNFKKSVKVTGDESLSRRDFSRITNPLKNFGAIIKTMKNELELISPGTLYSKPLKFEIPLISM